MSFSMPTTCCSRGSPGCNCMRCISITRCNASICWQLVHQPHRPVDADPARFVQVVGHPHPRAGGSNARAPTSSSSHRPGVTSSAGHQPKRLVLCRAASSCCCQDRPARRTIPRIGTNARRIRARQLHLGASRTAAWLELAGHCQVGGLLDLEFQARHHLDHQPFGLATSRRALSTSATAPCSAMTWRTDSRYGQCLGTPLVDLVLRADQPAHHAITLVLAVGCSSTAGSALKLDLPLRSLKRDCCGFASNPFQV